MKGFPFSLQISSLVTSSGFPMGFWEEGERKSDSQFCPVECSVMMEMFYYLCCPYSSYKLHEMWLVRLRGWIFKLYLILINKMWLVATIFNSEVLPDVTMELQGLFPVTVTIIFGQSWNKTQGDKDPLDSQNLGSMGGCHGAPHPEELHSSAAVANLLDPGWRLLR